MLLVVALTVGSGFLLFGGPQLASASGTVSAPTALGSANSGLSGSTLVITTSATAPVGATIFIDAAELTSGTSFSATDSSGNTYSLDKTQTTNAGVALLSAPVTTALSSGSTITVTFPTAGAARAVQAFYVTGLRTSSALDQTGTSSGSTNAVSVTSGSTTQSAEFVVAAWGEASNKAMTPTAPCSGPASIESSGNNVSVGYFDKSVSSTGTQTCAGAFSSGNPSWGAVIGTYKIDVTNPNAPAITFPSASFYGPNSWTTIAGTASDDAGGSGIGSDAVQIKDNTNSTYWNGTTWQASAISNNATGTTNWTYSIASSNLTDTHNYTVSVTSTDNATNVSTATTKSFTYDSTAPVYASSATNTAGTQVTLTYTEATSGLNTGITPATSAFTVTGCSASCSVTNVSVASSTTVVLTVATRIYGGSSVTVAYTQPASNKLQDNAGNLAATFAAQSVTNTAPASLSQSTVSASPNPIVSDGSTTSTITVQLKNSAGTNLSSSGGTVTVSTNLGTFASACTTGCSTTDNGNGTYTATLTSTSAGTATISAKLDGSSLTNTASLTINLASFTTNTSVSVSGTPTVGTSFTATAGSYSPSPTSVAYQWQRCDSAGANCVNESSGGTSISYTPVAGDVGGKLKVIETVSKSGYNDGSSSATSAVVVNGSFTTNTSVSTSGTPTVGTSFASTAGSYSPAPTSSSYQWRQCDSSGNSCSDIGGATSSSYTPVAGDVGHTLRVVETVSKSGYNNGGSTSAATPVVVNGSFTTNTAVSVSGTPTVGTSFASTAGSYTPSPTSSSYQWRQCDSSGNSCSDISGATSSSYTPVAGDVGHTLRVVETVSKSGYNNGGSTSNASAVVVNGSFTTNTAVSTSGTPTVGTSFAAIAGSYSPTPTSSSYQWRQCDSSGNSCSNISGATSSSYTPVAGDVGHTLRVVETVSKSGYNNGGSTSAASPVVVNGDFSTSTAVSINGTPKVGVSTTLTAGSYSPSPSGRSYQWEKCDNTGGSCSNIGGATSSTYTPVAGDVGSTLRVVETVSLSGYNNGGSTSAASPVVVNGDFSTSTAVAINGTPKVGVSTTITVGSYSPSPSGRSYQWEKCDNTGASCSNIGGATSSTYTPVAGDVGSTLRVVETVSLSGYNNGGSTSAASPVVVNGDFSTNTAVSVSGTPTVGTPFTATAGSYSPAPTGVAYQWERCDNTGANCVNISGATSISYTPVAGDVGSTLRIVETVSKTGYNNGGSTSSASSAVIKGDFTKISDISINGHPSVGKTMTVTNGVFSPIASSRSWQWELCDASGNSCAPIGGATSNTYTPVAGDYGSTLRVVETVSRAGYNDSGSTSAASTQVMHGDITASTSVSIDATFTVDTASSPLTPGTYTPTPTSVAYQWELCDANGQNCADIPSATSTTYTPVGTDAGSTLRVVETASLAGYNDGSSTSSASPVLKASFTPSTAVSIDGTPAVGTPTTLTAGSYSPSGTSFTYQWEKCDNTGASCLDITGATSDTYTPVAGDVGSTLRVVETVHQVGYNDGGSTSAASPLVVKGDFSPVSSVAIGGTPKVGTSSTLTVGSYTPSPSGYSYQWESCDAFGGNCVNLVGATSSAYTPVAADVGHTLRVVETVSQSGYNNGNSTSNASPAVVKGNFSTTTPVAINGQPKVGTATTSTIGVYSPAAVSRAYQWELCDPSGNNCTNIGGATTASYTPVTGDTGSTLRLVETVSKPGYNDGSSTSSAVLVYGIFATNAAVSINGTPTVGTYSSLTTGTYTPSPSGRTYQWKRCDSAGNSCVNISGAIMNTYRPVAADVGHKLRVVETVTKTNYVNGSSTSPASALVIKGTFSVTTTVAILGNPKHGVLSKITPGSYSPTPTSRSYQWMRCTGTTIASCTNIAGATAASYTPVAGDVGMRLRVVETAKKAGYNNLSVTSAASTAVL